MSGLSSRQEDQQRQRLQRWEAVALAIDVVTQQTLEPLRILRRLTQSTFVFQFSSSSADDGPCKPCSAGASQSGLNARKTVTVEMSSAGRKQNSIRCVNDSVHPPPCQQQLQQCKTLTLQGWGINTCCVLTG